MMVFHQHSKITQKKDISNNLSVKTQKNDIHGKSIDGLQAHLAAHIKMTESIKHPQENCLMDLSWSSTLMVCKGNVSIDSSLTMARNFKFSPVAQHSPFFMSQMTSRTPIETNLWVNGPKFLMLSYLPINLQSIIRAKSISNQIIILHPQNSFLSMHSWSFRFGVFRITSKATSQYTIFRTSSLMHLNYCCHVRSTFHTY